jgi:hypothetical protein
LFPIVALVLLGVEVGWQVLDPIPAGLAVLLSLVLWALSNLYFGLPLRQVFFYPLTALLYGVMAVRAGYYTLIGRSLTWKGRSLPARDTEANQ